MLAPIPPGPVGQPPPCTMADCIFAGVLMCWCAFKNKPEIPLNDPSSGKKRKKSTSDGLEDTRSRKKRDLLILWISNEGLNDIPTGRHQRYTPSSADLELLNEVAFASTDSVTNQNAPILIEELLDKMLSGSNDSVIVSRQVLEKQEDHPIMSSSQTIKPPIPTYTSGVLSSRYPLAQALPVSLSIA
ncbi:hypothetical protein IFR05_015540 [Cadophora sp. M221]|nr:hypothetical protein IFR05_015540 [Cadophora sp. M221]